MLRYSAQQAKWISSIKSPKIPKIISFNYHQYPFKPLTSFPASYFHQVKPLVPFPNYPQQEHNSNTQEEKYHDRSSKNLALILVGTGLFLYHSLQLYQWWTIPQPFDQFQASHQNPPSLEIPPIKDLNVNCPETCFLTKNLPNLLKDTHEVIIVSGEPGIGKTTAFKSYIDQTRLEKLPSFYLALTSEDNLSSILMSCFRTNDKRLIVDKLRECCKKGRPPVLVIDDVQYSYNEKTRRFTAGLLEFFQTFQENGGRVFLLSNVSSIAYEIANSSGYKFRSRVFEIQPRGAEKMKAYIRKEGNQIRREPLSEEQIERFCDLFGGNMNAIYSLYVQGNVPFEGKCCSSLPFVIQVEFVKKQEALISQNFSSIKFRCPRSFEFIEKLIGEKAIDFNDWIDLSAMELPADADSLLKPFEERDIIINRRMNEFKWKNGLTRGVVMSRIDNESKKQNGAQNRPN